jgi:hypothetical protein|tara:strand:- start:409 stop:1056 length:648 start_codon:yes stop_codon:yes gene_type:complete
MNSDIRPDKTSPAYLNKSSSGGLFIGFIYILVFMSILSLAIWQSFESKSINTTLELIDNRLVIIEEQINIADETNNDSLTDISSSIQFLDKEVRKLWDLSNKKNKVNIAKLSKSLTELEKISKDLLTITQTSSKEIKLNKQTIKNNELQINKLTLGISEMQDIQRTIKSLETQLILIDDSVQALNTYKIQLNQTIAEIQTEISAMDSDNLEFESE